jgi:hypothetical protein
MPSLCFDASPAARSSLSDVAIEFQQRADLAYEVVPSSVVDFVERHGDGSSACAKGWHVS